METPARLWSQHLANIARAAFWLLLVIVILLQLSGSRGLDRQRAASLGQFEESRNSRVIAMIHRQEGGSLFGVPVSGSISIDDSEAVLRAIRLTPPEQPIDIILHTPGGLVLAAEQIAKALVERKGKVTVFVPHYAMSGGPLIALAADEIVMDANAVLGPVDPQIGDMPAASIVKAVEIKGARRVSDEILILADISQKARVQVASFVMQVLLKHMPERSEEHTSELQSLTNLVCRLLLENKKLNQIAGPRTNRYSPAAHRRTDWVTVRRVLDEKAPRALPCQRAWLTRNARQRACARLPQPAELTPIEDNHTTPPPSLKRLTPPPHAPPHLAQNANPAFLPSTPTRGLHIAPHPPRVVLFFSCPHLPHLLLPPSPPHRCPD